MHDNSFLQIILTLIHFRITHWGRVTHICVGKLSIVGSDNGLSPGRRQAIIWTNAGMLLIGPLGTNFSEILIEILTFSFKKMRLKVSPAKWRPFCLGLNVLIHIRWKFHSALIEVVLKWSLWNFGHATTAVLLTHVRNFVAIWYPTMVLHKSIFHRIWITI